MTNPTPKWYEFILKSKNLPKDNLNEEQTQELQKTEKLLKMVEEGFVKVDFNPKKDAYPHFTPTEKLLTHKK
jgi:hypothetical protein